MNGKVFASQAIRDLYVLEVFAVFAGTARLTKTFGRQGFKALAFDKTSKRSEGQSVSKCLKVSWNMTCQYGRSQEVNAEVSFISKSDRKTFDDLMSTL